MKSKDKKVLADRGCILIKEKEYELLKSESYKNDRKAARLENDLSHEKGEVERLRVEVERLTKELNDKPIDPLKIEIDLFSEKKEFKTMHTYFGNSVFVPEVRNYSYVRGLNVDLSKNLRSQISSIAVTLARKVFRSVLIRLKEKEAEVIEIAKNKALYDLRRTLFVKGNMIKTYYNLKKYLNETN